MSEGPRALAQDTNSCVRLLRYCPSFRPAANPNPGSSTHVAGCLGPIRTDDADGEMSPHGFPQFTLASVKERLVRNSVENAFLQDSRNPVHCVESRGLWWRLLCASPFQSGEALMIAFRTTPRLIDLCIQTSGLSPTKKTGHFTLVRGSSRVLRLKAINLDCQAEYHPDPPSSIGPIHLCRKKYTRSGDASKHLARPGGSAFLKKPLVPRFWAHGDNGVMRVTMVRPLSPFPAHACLE